MDNKYWIDKINKAFELGKQGASSLELSEFTKRIYDNLMDEKAHHYATKQILQEIAEQIAIELTNIQEAKDEEAATIDHSEPSKTEYERFLEWQEKRKQSDRN